MEFREDEWVNLHYLSVLAEKHSIEQVNQLWGLEEDENRDKEVKKELNRLKDLRILKKDQDKFKANFKSQSFIDELKTFNKAHKIIKDEEKLLKHLKTMRLEGNREKLLNAQTIKKFYNEKKEPPLENPMHHISKILHTFEKEELPEKARLNNKQAKELIEKTKERNRK